MGNNLSDFIESYLKNLVDVMDDKSVQVSRKELATRFRCAPSQINYVLSTRFSSDKGYKVETKRGGGGYVRIFKRSFTHDINAIDEMEKTIGDRLTCEYANTLVDRFCSEGIVEPEDVEKLKTVLKRYSQQDETICASVLKAILAYELIENGEPD